MAFLAILLLGIPTCHVMVRQKMTSMTSPLTRIQTYSNSKIHSVSSMTYASWFLEVCYLCSVILDLATAQQRKRADDWTYLGWRHGVMGMEDHLRVPVGCHPTSTMTAKPWHKVESKWDKWDCKTCQILKDMNVEIFRRSMWSILFWSSWMARWGSVSEQTWISNSKSFVPECSEKCVWAKMEMLDLWLFFTRFPVVSLRSAAHVPFGSKVSGIGVGVAGAALPSSLARCKGLCQLDQFALRSPEGDVWFSGGSPANSLQIGHTLQEYGPY